jgi:hypothetical protein
MKLFEVDQGSARDVLAVLKGLANKPGHQQPVELPFPTVLNILRPFGLGIATPDGLIALKNNVDPQGSVIQDIKDDGTLVLNTNVKNPNDQPKQPKQGGGPSVDRMASSNAKNLKPDL